MSAAGKQVVKRLGSLATAPAEDDDGYYIVRQSGPNLCQILVTPDGLEGVKRAVAFHVKDGTPALYLVVQVAGEEEDEEDEERMVFYLDDSNHLRCNSLEDGVWEEAELHGLPEPVTVYPETQLSGVAGPDGIWVIYQTPKQELTAIVRRMGQWSRAGVIPAAMAQGATHVTLGDRDDSNSLHLFFPSKNGEICHTHGDFITGKWTAEIIENSHFPTGVSRFIVAPTGALGSYDIYAATGDCRLVRVSSNGDVVELGKIEGDQFIVLNRAERVASFGTGFYLDLPGAKYGTTDANVILTAAHNLIADDKTPTRQLKVISMDNQTGWDVKDDGYVKICPDYKENPDEDGSPFDWGVIFEPKNKKRKNSRKNPAGFGYNLSYAVDPPSYREESPLRQFMKSNVMVSGYISGKKIGSPVFSRQEGWPVDWGHLRYKASTQQGMSGSPVWATCDKLLTVVGIHTTSTNDLEPDTSQGVWLNLEVLDQIFRWAGVAYRSKSLLMIYDPTRDKAKDLYLCFSSPEAFGRVRLGATNLSTAFDILPAGRRTVDGRATHVFRFIQPPGWPTTEAEYLWVLWDVDQERVTLSSTLHKYSVVALVDERSDNNHFDPSRFGILPVGAPGGEDRELAMGSTYIRPEDSCYGSVESSEVSFANYDGATTYFFCFA
ncbi:hypothetical protein BJX76DRAFT_362532 [Aspergillus varians]